MKPILVINSGSSSLKYQLIDLDSEDAIAAGLIERVTSHEDAFAQMLSELTGPAPLAIGHRVVHGGSSFADPTLITDSVLSQVESLASLAPLHNPANVAGIRAARKSFPASRPAWPAPAARHCPVVLCRPGCVDENHRAAALSSPAAG